MLEIKDVYKTFNAGTINEKKALNGVNLKLNEGDFVTINWIYPGDHIKCGRFTSTITTDDSYKITFV